ncbi:MAG: hypothetical protein KIT69_02090 [Propionibacteriaceae bacterium]|nr:hypothetical protein [Propionibacteriaceae bacterium]
MSSGGRLPVAVLPSPTRTALLPSGTEVYRVGELPVLGSPSHGVHPVPASAQAIAPAGMTLDSTT